MEETGNMVRRYGVLTGRALDRQPESHGNSPHYHILIDAAGAPYRIAINTRSGSSHHRRADLLYAADDDFHHDITGKLATLDEGFQALDSRPGGIALDYQRGGMFDRRDMRRIPHNLPGPDNDLIDELDRRVAQAIANPNVRLHVFGTRWGPEPGTPDHVFGFRPGNGIHDVHMNQGNRDEHWHDNGVWNDGALLFHDLESDRWSAIFLAFQTQDWQTDESGNPSPYPRHLPPQRDSHPDRTVPLARIVAAFVHPNERKTGVEHVAIRNGGHQPLDVAGWKILNRDGDETTLQGIIPPRQVERFPLPKWVPLSANGDAIRLLDAAGQPIDEVVYTRRAARRKHGSLTF
jgi:uncharacterized protein YukJ